LDEGREQGACPVTASGATNHLLLHRESDKAHFYSQADPLFWSDRLKSWVSCDPATLREVQQSRDFAVVDQAAQGRHVTARLGLDLGHIERALAALPVCVEGEEHALRRKNIASRIAQRARPAMDRFGQTAERLCQEQLAASGARELVAPFFQPLGLGIAEDLSGLDPAPRADFLSPVQMFDKAMGPSRRKLVNEVVGDLWHQADERCPAGARDAAMALAILGGDTLWASLALSFAERLAAHPGARLCDIPWPDRLTRTAVPFIERTTLVRTRIAGHDVEPGEIIRLYLDRYSFEAEESRDAFFGSSRHVCLGRPLAQEAWRTLTESLRELPTRVELRTVSYREGDCMFLIPRSLEVVVHA
jgi:cytochrome P450